jgi:hypothetical protein
MSYLKGVSSWHTQMGHPDMLDDKPLVWRCWKGIKRKIGQPNRLDRQPITTQILQKMKAVLNPPSHYLSCMLWAAATTATYGLLRLGEFCTDSKSNKYQLLTMDNIALFNAIGQQVPCADVQGPTEIVRFTITLATSKTDPFRKGVTIHIANPVAVSAVLQYLQQHPSKHYGNSPLFQQQPGVALRRDVMIAMTRATLAAAGLDQSKYYGHSFRRGGATSLSTAGVSESLIQTIGRWRSDCYKLYIETPPAQLWAASKKM